MQRKSDGALTWLYVFASPIYESCIVLLAVCEEGRRGKLYSFCIEGFSNTQRRKQNHIGFNVLTSLFFIAPPQISNSKYKDELERRPIQGHTRHDAAQHIHIPTHCYSVVITALLHQDSILAGRTASIFELCLHLGFSYTPVQFRDFILQGCDIWLVFRLPGTWKSH